MNINDWDISRAKAKQWRMKMGNHSLKNESEWIPSAVVPTFVESNVEFKELVLELMVYGDTYQELIENRGMIISKLVGMVTLTFDNYTNYFDGILTKADPDEKVKNKWNILKLTFSGYEYKKETTIRVANAESTSFVINNTGNMETPVTLIINPTETTVIGDQSSETIYELLDSDGKGIMDTDGIQIVTSEVCYESLTINGICKDPQTGERASLVIDNINLGSTIVINGETGIITQDGESKIDDVTLWSLPTIEPGLNHITTNGDFMEIEVRYKPRVF